MSSGTNCEENVGEFPSQGIGFEELAQYFHLPINQVSKELGICATVLKKICRKNGIPRWPHRKIKSLDRMIKALETTVPTTTEEQERIAKEVEEMKTKKLSILRNPNSEGSQKYKPSKSSQQSKMKKPTSLSFKAKPTPSAHMYQPYPSPHNFATLVDDHQVPNSYIPMHVPASSPALMHPTAIPSAQPPSNQDIAHTVSEIISNLKARRGKSSDDFELRFTDNGLTSPLPPPSPTLSSFLPTSSASTTEATLSIMSNPFTHMGKSLPQLQGRDTTKEIASDRNNWPSLTIAPLLNQNGPKVALPIMEPSLDNNYPNRGSKEVLPSIHSIQWRF